MAATAHDRQRALELYEWNTQVSAGVLHDVAHLEIARRNAYNRAMPSAGGGRHWVFDPWRYFPTQMATARNGSTYDRNSTARDQLTKAANGALISVQQSARARQRQQAAAAPTTPRPPVVLPTTPPPGKVVAELMFGFWRYLSTGAHEKTLWVPYLHNAFPPKTNRADIDKQIEKIHKIRNRAAHHEPLLRADPATGTLDLSTQPLEAAHRNLLALAGLLSPEVGAFIRAHSPLPALLTTQP